MALPSAAASFAAKTPQPILRPTAGSQREARDTAVKPCSRATWPITCINPHEKARARDSVMSTMAPRATWGTMYFSWNAGSYRRAQGSQADSCSTIAQTNSGHSPCACAALRASATSSGDVKVTFMTAAESKLVCGYRGFGFRSAPSSKKFTGGGSSISTP